MLDRAQTIEKLKSTRQYLSEHYGVSSMLLFGSVARNEQKEDSDVDICVEMKPNLFKQAGVKVYLQELLGCSVDVVRMRETMNQLFKQQIQKYGVRVYWFLPTYPSIDWKGVMGVRDVIAHHYFEVDPDAVFDIIKNDLEPLKNAIQFFKDQLFQSK